MEERQAPSDQRFEILARRALLNLVPENRPLVASDVTVVEDRVRALVSMDAYLDAAFALSDYLVPELQVIVGRDPRRPSEPRYDAQILSGEKLVSQASSDVSGGHALLEALSTMEATPTSRPT